MSDNSSYPYPGPAGLPPTTPDPAQPEAPALPTYPASNPVSPAQNQVSVPAYGSQSGFPDQPEEDIQRTILASPNPYLTPQPPAPGYPAPASTPDVAPGYPPQTTVSTAGYPSAAPDEPVTTWAAAQPAPHQTADTWMTGIWARRVWIVVLRVASAVIAVISIVGGVVAFNAISGFARRFLYGSSSATGLAAAAMVGSWLVGLSVAAVIMVFANMGEDIARVRSLHEARPR